MQEGPSGGRDVRGRGPRRRGRPSCRRLRNQAGQFISMVTLFEVMTGGGAPAGTEHCWEGCPGGGGDVLLHGRLGAGRFPPGPWKLSSLHCLPTEPQAQGPMVLPGCFPSRCSDTASLPCPQAQCALSICRHSDMVSPPHPQAQCLFPILIHGVPSQSSGSVSPPLSSNWASRPCWGRCWGVFGCRHCRCPRPSPSCGPRPGSQVSRGGLWQVQTGHAEPGLV